MLDANMGDTSLVRIDPIETCTVYSEASRIDEHLKSNLRS